MSPGLGQGLGKGMRAKTDLIPTSLKGESVGSGWTVIIQPFTFLPFIGEAEFSQECVAFQSLENRRTEKWWVECKVKKV